MIAPKENAVNDLQAEKTWFQNLLGRCPLRRAAPPRDGMARTAWLASLVLVCVIALCSASLFGRMQQRERISRIGGRYSPELQQYLDEQNELLEKKPYWKIKSTDDSRTLVIPIEMAMQSVVRQYP